MALLLVAGVFTYNKLSFLHEKKVVIQKLEDYRKAYSIYPANLDELGEDFDKAFFYWSDSLRQSFILSYASGIMNVNTNRYDSQTKEWTQLFNY
jgi:hypothetical protein